MPAVSRETEFDRAYQKLNREQKEAVDAIEGPVMVIAGPGTGKTEILTMRIAQIRRMTDTPPEAILALTFTESGAAAMRKRLARLMGPDAYQVRITTFHGFANDTIRNYPEYFPEIIGSANITDVETLRIIQELIDEVELEKLRPANRPYYFVKAIAAAINDLKRENLRPEDFAKIVREERHDFEGITDLIHEKGAHRGEMKAKYVEELRRIEKSGELVRLYAAYEKKLRTLRAYDYNDMILEAARALEINKPLLRTIQEQYLYVLVDEHQDTNRAQNRIVELIASAWEDPNVFLVGDEHQAIYRFQGASRENFLYFKEHWPHLRIIDLKQNYRSTQAILDAAHALSPKKEKLTANAGNPEILTELWAFSSPEMEHYALARRLQAMIAAGIPAHEIAVLYRDNRDAFPIARMLERLGVPYVIESDQDVLEDEDVKKLISILKAVQHYGDGEHLVPVLHIDFFGIPPLDTYKIVTSAAMERSRPARHAIYDVIGSSERLRKIGVAEPERVLALARGLAAWKRAAKNRHVADAFEAIVRDSGFLVHVLSRPAFHEKIAKLHALFDQVKALIENHKEYTLEHFFDYLDLVAAHELSIKPVRLHTVPGRTRLMTAHKSKGQEFDHVFIVGGTDSHWGPRRRPEQIRLPRRVYALMEGTEGDNNEERDDDERNLFYVALTRGRREVVVSFAERNAGGREELPCRFLTAIEPHVRVVPTEERQAIEDEHASRRDVEFAAPPSPGGSAEDKEFLNAIFREQGLSVTALNNYLACPWRYFYLNLIRIPEAPQRALMFGNAVHRAIKGFFDARAAFGKGVSETPPGKALLITYFGQELRKEPVSGADHDALLSRGKKALAGWHDHWHAGWRPQTMNELSIDGIELDVDTTIKGKIDKLEFLGEDNAVNVVDYKTGKPKSRKVILGDTKSGDENYIRQLVFYKLLLDRHGKYRMASGELDFIEPDQAGKYHKESFTIEPAAVAELEALVKHVAREILDLAFWDRRCGDKDCAYCSLRAMTRQPAA